MSRSTRILLALGMAIAVGAGGAAYAFQGADGAVVAAVARGKAAGVVGEKSDGYLGFPKAAPGDVKAAADAVNITRRKIYTDIAAREGKSLEAVAIARGCEQLSTKVQAGESYQVDGAWKVKGGGAAELPAVCG